MNNPKISIIVPVYNMERYLKECLESIKAQTFTDWECIVVNDGSLDSSQAIIEKFVRIDPRFKLINTENGGQSKARNVALAASKGDYIGFVDSDDWIEPEMFGRLYKLATENNAEMALVGFWKEYNGRRSAKHYTHGIKVIDGSTAMKAMAYDKITNYLWNKLHRRDIITCEFPVGMKYEDIFVYGQWLRNVKKMVLDPTPLYHYRMRVGSTVHSADANNKYDYFLASRHRMEMIDNISSGANDVNKRNAYLNKAAVNACKCIARQEKDVTKRYDTIIRISDEIKSTPLPPIKFMKPKIWLRAKLLRNHPKIFILLMRGVHLLDLDSFYRGKQLYQ